MNERQPVARGKVEGQLHAVIKADPVLDDGCTEIFGAFYLIKRGAFGHDDSGCDAQTGGVVSDALGVVARATSDDTRLFLGVCEGQQFGQRAACFECVCVLQVFELEMQIDAQL